MLLKRAFGVAALLLLLLASSSCNFDKDITIELPPHVSNLAVECYLEPNQPPKLLLTETRSYFDSPEQPFINNATIRLYANGQLTPLPFAPVLDTSNKKVFNYSLLSPLSSDTNIQYRLEIDDTAGRKAVAMAQMLPAAVIDSVYWRFRDADSMAYIVTVIKAPQKVGGSYYRVLLNRNKTTGGAIRDYLADDALYPNGKVPVVSDYRYKRGDTLIVRVLHIERSYYDFLQSAKSASQLAGNPFAQPAPVRTNIRGGFGIFTAFIPTERRYIIR